VIFWFTTDLKLFLYGDLWFMMDSLFFLVRSVFECLMSRCIPVVELIILMSENLIRMSRSM
jgi:hypothetical protein